MTTPHASEFFETDGKFILVIDDSPTARAVVGSILEDAGYTVSYAVEALHGIQMALRGPCDLILMDIIMPDMHGIEACQKMQADPKLRDIPILMVTVAEESENLGKAFDAGAVDYLAKPIRRFELLARVKAALLHKAREIELIRKNEELEKAFKEIKVLRGFLPVCAWCHKIKDVKGYWHQMEVYIQEHSLAKFSHGICEKCVEANKMKGA